MCLVSRASARLGGLLRRHRCVGLGFPSSNNDHLGVDDWLGGKEGYVARLVADPELLIG